MAIAPSFVPNILLHSNVLAHCVQLTQLMSDSLGGNAKTLMFVNISPVDVDETQTSLTYAARVKLITNSAEKMQESVQVAKLKSIIAQLRAGNNPAFVDIEQEEAEVEVGQREDDFNSSTPRSRGAGDAASDAGASFSARDHDDMSDGSDAAEDGKAADNANDDFLSAAALDSSTTTQ